ncbi:hypothetical protein [Actinomadura kijaniata]|uniref:hypothetical protein n=1 Tax=Actinomadura kijaniata TaxID=46161 RepID=UPI000829D094|nr:hypothetical protein [Actinomadura kijaniata]
MRLRPGSRLRAAASTAEIIVVRAPDDEVDLRCGGAPMLDHDEPAPTAIAEGGDDLLIGKRYSDASGSLEVLVTKGGRGALTVGDEPLAIKAAKALPSSD